MISRDKTTRSVSTLRNFINNSLGLSIQTHKLTGFELSEPLLDAAAYNTYIETVGNKADTIYLHAKEIMNVLSSHS